MLGEAIQISREPGPLVVLRFVDRPSDEEFDAYLRHYEGILAEGNRYAVLLITMPNARMTPARQARKQAKWLAVHAEELSRLCAGIAFVLPSPVSRGVYRAILKMQSLPMPHTVAAAEDDARAWALGQLGVSGQGGDS